MTVRGLFAVPVCLLVGALAPSVLFAQQPDRPVLIVDKIQDAKPPTIDGKVDDEAWDNARAYGTFTQQEPNDGEPASERTELRFLLSRTMLYIAVVAFDAEPEKIIVSESRRDAVLTDTDSVQILLDTLNDGQNGFVFGTNPFGIEYDGQVMGEGQAGPGARGGGGGLNGGAGTLNMNWDADWTVRAAITSRGWEAEFAIPLKTVRYKPGSNETWGVNVTRNIRRKNEQVYLSRVPRGYNLQRVSVAGKLTGLDLPVRRQLQLIPFGVSSVADNRTLATDQVSRSTKGGFDAKWGLSSTLTFDATVNTDFAQVEADEQQINLTRFALFFPEKRPFFLENAQTFQLGQTRSIDLFFSRRIGIGADGAPVPIIGGGRLSGKVNHFNIGLLNMQTDSAVNKQTGAAIAPSNNFSVLRVQREIGRSNFGAMVVNRQGSGKYSASSDYNRSYGVDLAWQATTNGKLFTFLARTDSPAVKGGSDHAGRLAYSYANRVLNTQVGKSFNPEVGFLSRAGYRSVQTTANYGYQPKRWPWIRRIAPHMYYNVYWDLGGQLSTGDGHWHPFEIYTRDGGQFGYALNTGQDNPTKPFTIYSDATGRKVVIPVGRYAWKQGAFEWHTNQSAPLSMILRHRIGSYYTGHAQNWDITISMRTGPRLSSDIQFLRDAIKLPYGNFTNNLIPLKVAYSFTKFANLQGLLQYNSQASTFSSNLRFALLNRSGTGLFVVYNNQKDTSSQTPATLLGQSFIIKLSRLFDF